MVDRQALINAFAKVLHPGDAALCFCPCGECQWQVAEFKGKKWSQLKVDDFGVEKEGANVALLTPTAFHYFLPGLVLLTLDNPDGVWLVDRIIHRLIASHQDTEEHRSSVQDVIKRLSTRQRAALIDAVATWRLMVICAPTIWECLIATLRDGKVTQYSVSAIEDYNGKLLASHLRPHR